MTVGLLDVLRLLLRSSTKHRLDEAAPLSRTVIRQRSVSSSLRVFFPTKMAVPTALTALLQIEHPVRPALAQHTPTHRLIALRAQL